MLAKGNGNFLKLTCNTEDPDRVPVFGQLVQWSKCDCLTALLLGGEKEGSQGQGRPFVKVMLYWVISNIDYLKYVTSQTIPVFFRWESEEKAGCHARIDDQDLLFNL